MACVMAAHWRCLTVDTVSSDHTKVYRTEFMNDGEETPPEPAAFRGGRRAQGTPAANDPPETPPHLMPRLDTQNALSTPEAAGGAASSAGTRGSSVGAPGSVGPVGIAHDLGVIAGDIKLAHSVFAMPFALLGAALAAAPMVPSADGSIASIGPDWRRFGAQLALVVLAMVFARTCAMLANRIIDRDLDVENQRTARRALPSGRLSFGRAVAVFAGSAAIFMGVCAAFLAFGNPWPLLLGLPVLAWICAYGFLKRFSAMCHVYLGSSLAISPIAAAIAIDPAQVGQPTLWLIAAMVLCWVAGFDVIYALQDVDADRRQGLHSMPSRWGVPAAMWASRGLHAIAVVCLWTATIGDSRFGVLMRIGAAVATALLIIEHATVARWGTTRMALTFFTLNGVISCVVGGLGIVDVLMS